MDNTEEIESEKAPTVPESEKYGVTKTEMLISEEDQGDPAFVEKAGLINDAFQEIGFGKYQRFLFCVCGFGWLVDNGADRNNKVVAARQVTAIIVPQIVNEFHLTSSRQKTYLTLSQNIGLLLGAVLFGCTSDVIGRRWAFNLTLLITGVFGTVAGASPNFPSLCVFAFLWSTGVGGSLPALFFLSLLDKRINIVKSRGDLLESFLTYKSTILSIWWAGGQILASLVAWPLLANFACPDPQTCTRANNWGWRYFLFAMGGFTMCLFVIRFFIFDMKESPKFLVSKLKDPDAIGVLNHITVYNGTRPPSITEEDFKSIDRRYGRDSPEVIPEYATRTAALRRNLEKFRLDHVRALFATRRLKISTSLILLVWAIIGLAFPLYNAFLPYLLESQGAKLGNYSTNITYRNYVIIGLAGLPGSLIGGWAVEQRIGRKGSMAIFTALTGILLYCSTTARTSDALLGWNIGYGVTSNAMYAVLYAYTPEVFVSRDRGTGTGLAASANRIFGIMSPIIAGSAAVGTVVPVYISGGLFIAAGVLMMFLVYEPRGKLSPTITSAYEPLKYFALSN